VLDRDRDQTLVLAVIGLPTIAVPNERQRWCERIRALIEGSAGGDERLEADVKEDIRTEVDEQVLEDVSTTLVEEKLSESVPFLGEAIGIVLDSEFVLQVEEAARCIFQEHWLRDNGKIETIPARESTRDVLDSIASGLETSIYTLGYGVGFGLTFPGAFVYRAGVAILWPRAAAASESETSRAQPEPQATRQE
jgi:hypothetical protein